MQKRVKENTLKTNEAFEIFLQLIDTFIQIYPKIELQFTPPDNVSEHTFEDFSFTVAFYKSAEEFGCFSTLSDEDSSQYAFCSINEKQTTKNGESTYVMNFSFNFKTMTLGELFDIEYYTSRGYFAFCSEQNLSDLEHIFGSSSLRLT